MAQTTALTDRLRPTPETEDAVHSVSTGPPRGPDGRALTPEAVFGSHFDFVWRSLRRLGVAPQLLDDAVQEVFVVVCRRLHTLQGEELLRPWLFSIARHVAHKAWRAERRRGADPLPEVLADDRAVSPQEAAARAEAVGVVHRLLEQLSEPQRAVFVLAHLEQWTAPEIATSLGLPLNTVYSRLRAARMAMEAGLIRHRAYPEEKRPTETESA